MTDGDTYLDIDINFYKENFFDMMTSASIKFLKKEENEFKEPPLGDGSFAISAQKLVDRLIWWDAFSNSDCKSIFHGESMKNENTYLDLLMNGSDNEDLFDDKRHLSEFFSEAAKYLKYKYPNTEFAKRIPLYYHLRSQGKKQEADNALEPFVQKGMIE